MNITNEAAYLYVLSKELTHLNKKIKNYCKEAHGHAERHARAVTEEEKARHRYHHGRATSKIADLIKKHNVILARLRHHQVAFSHALRLEHKAMD